MSRSDIATRLSRACVFAVCVFLAPEAIAQPLTLKNHTPKQFPWSRNDVPRSSEALDPDETPQSLMQVCRNGSHKFVLEAKPGPSSRILSAAVIVDGATFQMSEVGTPDAKGRLFVYEPTPPRCGAAQQRYAFAVKYEQRPARGTPFTRVQTLRPSPNGSFTVKVLGANRLLWWVGSPGFPVGVTTESQKDVSLEAREDGTATRLPVSIQRLSKLPMRVAFIGLDSQGDGTFRLENLVPLSREIQCQEVVQFDLVWTPLAPDFTDRTALVFVLQFFWDGRWIDGQTVVVSVLTRPYTGPGLALDR